MTLPPFSTRLLQWWDKNGRKDLPWQHPRTPYRVWVSEIMLQQTQVKTVIPYFNNFLERFPDIDTLARASADDVMSHWSGLGYYARARNLLKTAIICQQEHGGDLPRTPELLANLPGIGQSTANAIYSQAHDRPAAVLDGNVKRVLTRYFAVEGWPGKSSIHQQLWLKAEALLPAQRGADYTQAAMDLGATVCTRTKPQCEQCPVSSNCQAYLGNSVDRFPARRPKLKKTSQSFRVLILTDGEGGVMLERRPPAGIWGGLWSLPADEPGKPAHEQLGLDLDQLTALPELQHQLTHIEMTIQPLITDSEFAPGRVECTSGQRWFARREWPQLGLPKPVRQLLETYLESDEK